MQVAEVVRFDHHVQDNLSSKSRAPTRTFLRVEGVWSDVLIKKADLYAVTRELIVFISNVLRRFIVDKPENRVTTYHVVPKYSVLFD